MRLILGGGQTYDLQVTKLTLQHQISKKGMICFAKPGLSKDFYIVKKQ
jgi:hypothetical protein